MIECSPGNKRKWSFVVTTDSESSNQHNSHYNQNIKELELDSILSQSKSKNTLKNVYVGACKYRVLAESSHFKSFGI